MQAQTLKELGFKEPTSCYYSDSIDGLLAGFIKIRNNDKNHTSVPTIDEAIDWLRRKYHIVIYNQIEPFVDPTDDTHKNILFKYGVKRCDVNHLGWNGRINIGTTRLNTNVYSLKREAISIAIKYIKSQKNG